MIYFMFSPSRCRRDGPSGFLLLPQIGDVRVATAFRSQGLTFVPSGLIPCSRLFVFPFPLTPSGGG